MRTLALLIIACLPAIPAAAQGQASSQVGASAKQAGYASKFRQPGIRPATMRARAAARRARTTISSAGGTAEEGRGRMAAAARRRSAAGAAPARESATLLADRLTIQLDLAWTGDYTGLINGEGQEKTTASVKAFQRNRKFKESGVLNTQERALLAASAKAKQVQVGWAMIDDLLTGARIGIPTKQVPNKNQSKMGTRWSSAQGQVQVETFRIREPGTTLASVYEQQRKEPSTRKLETNLLRGDFFVLSGMQGLKRFYVRADFKDGEVRGMTVLYDQATENIMNPAAVVMASAFTAFPNVSGVAQIGAAAKRKVEYGSGIVVSQAGHILTDRALTDGCNIIVVSGYGDADLKAADAATDLALLRVYGVPDLAPAGFSSDPAKGPDVMLVGIADPQTQAGGSAISVVNAKLKGDTPEPAPQLGFSGAAVLDAQYRLIGMVELKIPTIAAAGISATQPQANLVPASSIRAFLEGQKLSPAVARSGLEAAKASVVRVICVRK